MVTTGQDISISIGSKTIPCKTSFIPECMNIHKTGEVNGFDYFKYYHKIDNKFFFKNDYGDKLSLEVNEEREDDLILRLKRGEYYEAKHIS